MFVVVGISDFPMTARRTHRANTGPDPTEYYSYVPNTGPQQGGLISVYVMLTRIIAFYES